MNADAKRKPQAKRLVGIKVQIADFGGAKTVALRGQNILAGLEKHKMKGALVAGSKFARQPQGQIQQTQFDVRNGTASLIGYLAGDLSALR